MVTQKRGKTAKAVKAVKPGRSKLSENLRKTLRKHEHGAKIMMELPAASYFENSLETVKHLVSEGYSGIYISFIRPFTNLYGLLESGGIDVKKLFFVDVASALVGDEQIDHERCIHVPDNIPVDDLVRAIYVTLPKLPTKRQFIFIDSLTPLTLYKPLSETMRFSEFLVRTVQKEIDENRLVLVFNVASDLAQKKFIKDIALRVDEVIRVGP
ncbi:MAG: hypothetical protein ABIC95_00305 [archaeon]